MITKLVMYCAFVVAVAVPQSSDDPYLSSTECHSKSITQVPPVNDDLLFHHINPLILSFIHLIHHKF